MYLWRMYVNRLFRDVNRLFGRAYGGRRCVYACICGECTTYLYSSTTLYRDSRAVRGVHGKGSGEGDGERRVVKEVKEGGMHARVLPLLVQLPVQTGTYTNSNSSSPPPPLPTCHITPHTPHTLQKPHTYVTYPPPGRRAFRPRGHGYRHPPQHARGRANALGKCCGGGSCGD